MHSLADGDGGPESYFLGDFTFFGTDGDAPYIQASSMCTSPSRLSQKLEIGPAVIGRWISSQ